MSENTPAEGGENPNTPETTTEPNNTRPSNEGSNGSNDSNNSESTEGGANTPPTDTQLPDSSTPSAPSDSHSDSDSDSEDSSSAIPSRETSVKKLFCSSPDWAKHKASENVKISAE